MCVYHHYNFCECCDFACVCVVVVVVVMFVFYSSAARILGPYS